MQSEYERVHQVDGMLEAVAHGDSTRFTLTLEGEEIEKPRTCVRGSDFYAANSIG